MNFGDMILPDAKLVVFRFSSKEEFAKIASQDLVKCFPNAVIAGFKFKVNGIKGFTNFLHSPNFYKLLNGDSSKDNSDESNKKRITKLLNSDEFKSLCKKNISSDFFYSSAIDEDLYLKANSSEIENYISLSKAIQCEINKNNDPDKLAKIKNSAVFVGTVMFDAFESLVNDEDLQYNVAIIKNAHHDIYEQFKKKDFDLIFPGYSMPIKTLSGVRPGDIMLSVDDDIMSENFHIVSSVGNDGKVDIVGLNKGKKISKKVLGFKYTCLEDLIDIGAPVLKIEDAIALNEYYLSVRKDSGSEVTDKIRVEIESTELTTPAVESFGDYIASQTLAVEVKATAAPAGDFVVNTDIDESPLKIAVTKA